MWMKHTKRISVLLRVSICEWLITAKVARVSNPVPLLDSAKTRLCVQQQRLIKPILWQATSSNDDDFCSSVSFRLHIRSSSDTTESGISSGIKMMCNPAQKGWESRVNSVLRCGSCFWLAVSCDNYCVIEYYLTSNIRFDKLCWLTRHCFFPIYPAVHHVCS